MAKRIVAANGLASEQGGPITILSGRLEALLSLPVDKVRLRLQVASSPCILCLHATSLLHLGSSENPQGPSYIQ